MGTVQQALATHHRELARGLEGEQQVHEVRGAVDDRRIHDGPHAGRTGIQYSREQAHREIERAAPEIAEERGWRDWRLAAAARIPEGAREREVVVVVAGGAREGPALPPTRHASVH